MKRLLIGVAVLTLLTGVAQVPRVRPIRPPQTVEQVVSGWPKYCGNISMNGTPSGDSPIDAKSIVRMRLAWKTPLKGPVASAPSVLGDTLYVGDWGGFESAIDTRSGKILAQADLGRTFAVQCYPAALGITSSPAIVGNMLYLAGGDDGFYALDRNTLAVVWRKSLGDNSQNGGYYGWSSPAVVGNRVLQGIASDCDNPFVNGRLVALDRTTGEEVAVAQFVEDGKIGNGVWTSPSVDLEHRTIFVTTASGLDWSDGLGYSIVRLNLDTLAIEDSWKVNLGPTAWDGDWGSSPTLFSDRTARQLVGAGHKDGHYYAFLRSNLAAGPVWKANVSKSGDTPQDGDGTLSTAAFDGERLYVGGGTPPSTKELFIRGTLVALDPATGKILWRHGFPGPVIAPISTVNGVVFAAGNNLVEALDATTGRVLWSFRTDGTIYGGIAITGDTIFVGDLSGNLYAFRIS